MHLSIENEGDQIEVFGRFSPHPTIWSAFLAMYLAIAFAGLMGVVFGYSQWILGLYTTGLWSGPIAIFLTSLVYLAARIGRRLGEDQMRELSDFLTHATGLSL
ncbi:MAG: hypothetical protein ACI84D_001269, partial [Thalassolituus oleivorans]